MKKIILSIIFVLLIVSIVKAQTAELTISQVNDGVNIDVSIFIKRTGVTPWNMGNGSFVFNFNMAAINTGGASILSKGQWDVTNNTNYNSMFTANYGPGIARSLEIDININPGGDVPATPTLVGTLRMPITNPAANHNITWNAPFSAVQTDIGDEIDLTFINPVNSLLPVELSGFSAAINKNEVTLQWQTVSEVNNSGFNIERLKMQSTDSMWSNVSFVQGNGNSNEAKEYKYQDKNLNSGEYKYRLKQIDYNGNYSYFELNNTVTIETPLSFRLSQNYPNPFNPSTKIDYDLPYESKVSIQIYDISGREIATLVNSFQKAGYYTVQFNGINSSSGIYFYHIKTGNFSLVKKMVLVK